VVLGDGEAVSDADLAAVRDLGGAGVPVHRAVATGAVVSSTAS
jgi:hypothetical protein